MEQDPGEAQHCIEPSEMGKFGIRLALRGTCLLEAVNSASGWARSLNFVVFSGVGWVSGRDTDKPEFQQTKHKFRLLCSCDFFVYRKPCPQHSCLLEGKTQKEVKNKGLQPSGGLKHGLPSAEHTHRVNLSCPPSQKPKTLQPKHDQLTHAKIS